MVFHMKTTLIIDDYIMMRLRREAVTQRKTISQLVESAIRAMLRPSKAKQTNLPPLPSFKGGSSFVDISNREALYQIMESK